MPIRVLHIVTYMGRGGLETMLMNYYRHIDRNIVQFDFLVHRSFEADYDKEIESLGGKIFHLPKLNPFSKTYLDALDSFFKEHKEYNIVHSHLDCMAGIPLKYAKKNGVPVRIAHAHSSNQNKDIKYLLKLLFKHRIVCYATDLFACGEEAGKWMFNGAKFRILNNAIDAKSYSYNQIIREKVRTNFNIPNQMLIIGHVGRFNKVKNHDFLLDVFAETVKINPNSKLLLVGDGELRKTIEDKIKRLDLEEKVILTGVRSDVSELLQAMDVFVLPSLFEGLGIVAIEAQAAGLPVLISDKVPLECKITENLVHQISLSASSSEWAKQILDIVCTNRINTYNEIVNSMYDIKNNAERLQRYYCNKV